MKFFDESAKAQICVRSIVRVDVVHDLVAMVVHLNFAMRTNHFVSFSHNGILVSGRQSREICSRPWRNVFAIQMSSFRNLSMRRM